MKLKSLLPLLLLLIPSVSSGQIVISPPAIPAGIGTITGGTCTNQAVTAISTTGVPTCTTLTAAYITSPGSDTQVLFNDSNVIAGDVGLTWDKTTDSLILTTASSSDQLRFINSTAGPTHFSEIGVDTSGSLQLNADNNNVSITISADGTVYGDKWNGSLFEFYTNGIFRTDTTTAHTASFQAYDVNGTAYKTFATLTNGDTPDFTIAPPAGTTVNIQGVYKSNDGTTGLTQTCAAAVVAVTVKNGLITAITCP